MCQCPLKSRSTRRDADGHRSACGCWRRSACRRPGPRHARVYQASTSELLWQGGRGTAEQRPRPSIPVAPYAVARRSTATGSRRHYREAYGMYCGTGIWFNHESERRGETFVTRKITLAAGRIAAGPPGEAVSGEICIQLRDWGYAKDYVECMWLILQQREAGGFCHCHRRAAFRAVNSAEQAFHYAGIGSGIYRWEGTGLDEKGHRQVQTGKVLV